MEAFRQRAIFWLLAALLGCGAREEVHVAGAVPEAGAYGYRKGWEAADYVAAAGGYLTEAEPEAAFLVRTPADSSGARRIDYTKSLRWALAEAPEVLPGDQIVVPRRTYAVRLDTVRRVDSLVVRNRGRTYRVGSGLMAPGWTERGVMVAVAIGRGEVLEGGERVSMFHYLHMQMHPGRYAELLPCLAEVVHNPEALEDVGAIHASLFERSAYQSGGRAEAPPEGYLHVQAGVWLAPRSRAYPGPGMRRRRFSDGRVWTTYPDGRQRTVYPDGKAVVEFPGGSQEVRYADGRTELLDTAGNRQVRHPDGREVWERPSGDRVTAYPDGRRIYRRANGDLRTIEADGTDRTVFADGTLHVRHPDGRVEVRTPDGLQETRRPDGRVTAVTPEGHEVVTHPGGRRVTRLRDGTRIEVFPDGRKVQENRTGEVVEVYPDGRRRVVYGDGAEMVRGADGTARVRYGDGTVMDVYPGGRRVQRNAGGAVLEVFPDGRRVEVDAMGNRIEAFPDGRQLKAFADPYAYRGSMRPELVRLERAPEAVAPGGRALIAGSVADSVQRVEIAAFRLPDGDVSSTSVRVRNGQFRGELKLREAGLYRLQVQADVGLPAPVTAVDRALKVGQPEALAAPVLEVFPYRGPEAAQERLLGLINEARARLGREPVQFNPWLMKVAEYRLSEMLALDYFSHASPIGKEAARLVQAGPVRFRRVGENLGQGPSVVEAHMQLMLSAGHRRNILDRGWTDAGLAVAQEGRSVWVVEVFGQR